MFDFMKQQVKKIIPIHKPKKKILLPRHHKVTTLTLDSDPILPMKKMKALLDSGAQEKFLNNSPFPYIVIDDFFDESVLNRVLAEFPYEAKWYENSKQHEIKSSLSDFSLMPAYITEVLNTLNSGIFTLFLEKLTGIKGLIPDPHLKGGGIHYTKRGGKLGVHRDFNFYPRLKLYRRLNIIIFLNKDWDDRWEGHLELWDKDLKNRVKKVAPKFNRVVIFETSNISYHGHPVPLNTPDDIARKSLALYYYSVDYPYQDDLEPHSTIFKDDLVN